MNWNILWDHDEGTITLTFAEAGYEEPVDEFEDVKDSCPILLDNNDSTEQMLGKVRDFCLAMQSKGV